MRKPTKLEKSILAGAVKAQRNYESMTGAWLDHAPESFINIHVALAVANAEYYAYVDTSLKRIHADIDSRERRGRKVGFEKERPDVAVWYRTRNSLIAIVETKNTYNSAPLKRDVEKVRRHLNHARSAKYGYLLVHTTNGRKNATPGECTRHLRNKLDRWAEKVGLEFVDSKICRPSQTWHNKKTGRRWGWGIALYRYDKGR